MATHQQLARIQQDRLDILARAGLKMAGFKPRDLKRAYQALLDGLSASKVQVSYDRQSGQEVSRIVHIDHIARIMAAREICKMIPDMFPTAHGGAIPSGQGVIVEVVLCTPNGERTAIRVDTHTHQPTPLDDSNDQAI